MPASLSLLEFVELLSDSAQVRSDFALNPDATLSAYGLDNMSPDDVRDAIVLAEDVRTVDWSAAYGAGAVGAGGSFGAGHDAAGSGDHDDLGTPYGAPADPAVDALWTDPDPPEPDHGAAPDAPVEGDLQDVLDDVDDLHLG